MTEPAASVEIASAQAAPVKDTARADARKTVRVVMQEYLRRGSIGPIFRLLLDLAVLGMCIGGACYFDAWWAKALMVIPGSVAKPLLRPGGQTQTPTSPPRPKPLTAPHPGWYLRRPLYGRIPFAAAGGRGPPRPWRAERSTS